MERIVKFRKVGNSLAISIPIDLANDLEWKEDDYIRLIVRTLAPAANEQAKKFGIHKKILIAKKIAEKEEIEVNGEL